jgi:hypothetical protein
MNLIPFLLKQAKISQTVSPPPIEPQNPFFPLLKTPPDFELGNINTTHVSDIIKSFPNKQSLDINGISLKLLKFVNVAISIPLAHIFNLSFTNGIFPQKLKTNRTVPIFKSGDPCLCDNYRPISQIPTLPKII